MARDYLATDRPLHVLVNNAGVVNLHRTLTVDGIETVFAVNHLAYFLLTNLLLDRLKASAPARIVNVASDAHRFGTMNFDDLGGERSYRAMRIYGQSKLANILFTYELARRLAGDGGDRQLPAPGGRGDRPRQEQRRLGEGGDRHAPPLLPHPRVGCRDLDLPGVLTAGRRHQRQVLQQLQRDALVESRRTTPQPRAACGRSVRS